MLRVDSKIVSPQSLYSLPASAGVFLALTVPAYLLTGIHYPHIADLNSFYTYLGYMMLFLLSSQLMAVLLSNLLASRHMAAVVTGLVATCQALVSHYLIHRDDLPPWVQWIRYVSPQFWMTQPVLRGEFSGVKTFLCRHNPIINDEQTTIIKQVNCLSLPVSQSSLTPLSRWVAASPTVTKCWSISN